MAKGKEEDVSLEGVLGDKETQDQWKLRKHRAKAGDGVGEALGVDPGPHQLGELPLPREL